MMRRHAASGPGEAVLDLGCGAGKFALYAGREAVRATGVDVAPFFLPRAVARGGPGARRPAPAARSARAPSLAPTPSTCSSTSTRRASREVLLEARRALVRGRPALRLHPRHGVVAARRASSAGSIAWPERLGRAGLVDHEREAMRKSDHLNAIRSHEHFDALAAGAGLERRRASLLQRGVQGGDRGPVAPAGRAAAAQEDAAAARARFEPAPAGQAQPSARPRPGRLALAVAQGLTWLLKLDVVLFGGIRTGPFFGLLRPRRERPDEDPLRGLGPGGARATPGAASTSWRWPAASPRAATRSTRWCAQTRGRRGRASSGGRPLASHSLDAAAIASSASAPGRAVARIADASARPTSSWSATTTSAARGSWPRRAAGMPVAARGELAGGRPPGLARRRPSTRRCWCGRCGATASACVARRAALVSPLPGDRARVRARQDRRPSPGAPTSRPFARSRAAPRCAAGWASPRQAVAVLFSGSFRPWHGVQVLRGGRAAAGRTGPTSSSCSSGGRSTRTGRAATAGSAWARVPYERMPEVVAAADIGVAPYDTARLAQLRLGFYWSPLKIFESMASGVADRDHPALSAHRDRARGRGGALLPRGRRRVAGRGHRAPRRRCRRFAQRLGQNARARVVAHYSWARHCEQLEDLLGGSRHEDRARQRGLPAAGGRRGLVHPGPGARPAGRGPRRVRCVTTSPGPRPGRPCRCARLARAGRKRLAVPARLRAPSPRPRAGDVIHAQHSLSALGCLARRPTGSGSRSRCAITGRSASGPRGSAAGHALSRTAAFGP